MEGLERIKAIDGIFEEITRDSVDFEEKDGADHLEEGAAENDGGDTCSDGDVATDCQQGATSKLKRGQGTSITPEAVNTACDQLKEDSTMPPEVHTVCKNVDRQALVEHLQFLDGCLVKKRAFKNAAKEKAWTNFYKEMSEDKNIDPLHQLVPPEVSMWICMEVFSVVLSTKYECLLQQTTNAEDSEVPQEEKHIIAYIGGSCVQKMNQRTYRLKTSDERQEKFDCLAALCTDSTSEDTLTGLLDRGGLVKLHPNAEELFLCLESRFRAMFSGFEQMSFESYFHHCSDLDSVSTRFHEQLYDVRADSKTKEKLLREIIHVYFNIRAHHKCKTYMDEVNRLSHKCKREKALRRRLKQGKEKCGKKI